MLKISKNQVLKDYKYLKKKAFQFYQKNKIDEAISIIETCALIAYSLNFRFVDEELEQLCSDIGCFLLSDFKEKNRLNLRQTDVVLYDCFALDSRGLTQQYMRALEAAEIPYTFIYSGKAEISLTSHIMQELTANPHAQFVALNPSLSGEGTIRELASIITQVAPKKAFMHMTPNDVVGVASWGQFDHICRYQINLTDHAFWLGTSCINYNIEFREYGRSLSIDHRKIAGEKELYLPYYPIRSETIPFEGFPFEKKDGMTVLFSGGALYKFYGENDKYFELIKRILDENNQTVLVVAGDGNKKPFNSFIKKNKFEDRVFLVGNRKDISAVFDNVDIFIGSYPMCGGLMSQFAVEAGVPVVQYTAEDLPINIIDTLFPKRKASSKLTWNNENKFVEFVSSLIQNSKLRDNVVRDLNGSVPTSEEFNQQFSEVLNVTTSSKIFSEEVKYDISSSRVYSVYFEAEKYYLKSYYGHYSWKTINILAKHNFRIPFLASVFRVKNKLKKLLTH